MKTELDRTLEVCEIYKSIQGESSWAGMPCIFIRLAGCNLRCAYCDSTHAYEGGTKMTIAQILEKCRELDCGLVEITGGEPLWQQATANLAEHLDSVTTTVLVETNGTMAINSLPCFVIKIMDIKCPSSGESDKIDWDNLDCLEMDDEVKFVISDRRDYDWSCQVIEEHQLDEVCYSVLFSPAFGTLDPKELAAWILEDGLKVRLQLQQHKYIWPPGERGV